MDIAGQLDEDFNPDGEINIKHNGSGRLSKKVLWATCTLNGNSLIFIC